MEGCPRPAALESLALTDDPGPALLAHIESCAACAAMVCDIRENREFLRRHAGAIGDALPGSWLKDESCRDPGLAPGYELLEVIGQGGQGVVYRAVQIATRRPAAVKLLLGGVLASPRQRVRFEREVELAASLRHPSIVSVFDSGLTDRGARFVAMEFVDGVPIDEYCGTIEHPVRGSRAWIDAVTRLFVAVASGVGHAHSRGVIHRDLKPSNILVDRHGVPRVLDFGLARHAMVTDSGAPSITREFAGTPAFAAPEQLLGVEDEPSARSDVYALVVTLYRALTGAHPIPCEGSFSEIIRHAAETEPTPPSHYLPKIPADLETIILRGLSKDPHRRYSDANALCADLEHFLAGEPIDARRDSAWYVLSRLALKHKPIVGAGVIVACTLLAGVIGLAFLATDLDKARRSAEASLAESAVQRARLMGSLGDTDRAEQILWGEAVRVGMADDVGIGFTGSPEAIRSAWSLMELYARMPRRFRTSTNVVTPALGFDRSNGAVWSVDRALVRTSWDLSGRGRSLSAAPALKSEARLILAPRSEGGFVAFAATRSGLSRHDLRTGAVVGPVSIDADSLELTASDDGRYLACVTRGPSGAITIYDAATLRVVTRMLGDAFSVSFARIDGGLALLVGSWTGPDARVSILAEPDWAVVRTLAMAESSRSWRGPTGVRVPRLSPNERYLAAGYNSDLHLFDIDNQHSPLIAVVQGRSPIQTIDFGGSDSTLAVGRHDGEVTLYSIPTLEPLATFPAGKEPSGLAYEADAGVFALGESTRVSVYDAADRPWLTRIPSQSRSVPAVAVSSTGTRAWAGEEGTLMIQPTRDDQARVIPAHAEYVNSVAFSPDGSLLVTGAADGQVRLWSEEGVLVRVIGAALGGVGWGRFSPDGGALAAATDGAYIHLWGVDADRASAKLRADADRVPMIAFSPDGSLIGAGAAGIRSAPTVWDAATGKRLVALDVGGVATRAVAFSPDGRVFVTASDDRVIRLWDARTGAPLRAIGGLPWGPYDLAFHPTGRVLFTVGPGGDVVVLDPVAAAEVATIHVHEKSTFSVAVSRDGSRLFTAGQDPFIGVVDLSRLAGYVRGNAPYWRESIGTTSPLSR